MDLREAVEKAQRILLEAQTKSTRQYKYAKETGVSRGCLVRLPDIRGIGFEAKNELFRVMKADFLAA